MVPALALGAGSGHRLSVSVVTALAWAEPCYQNCAARHRKPRCIPSLASLPLACLAVTREERGQRGGIYWHYFTRGGVGIFPCPFRRHRSWPRPKARANLLFICFGFFVPVCAVFTAVVQLMELVPERGDGSLELGTWLLRRQRAVSPCELPRWRQARLGYARTGAHSSGAAWEGVCTPTVVKLVDVAATALALASEIPSCFVLRTRCMLYSAECFRDTTKL